MVNTWVKLSLSKKTCSVSLTHLRPIQNQTPNMAPKSLLKTLKYKPPVKLNMDDLKSVEKETVGNWVKPKMEIPLPTPQELIAWARARELQQVDEAGNPVEGWAARLATMKLDGRLWYNEESKMWHRRGVE